MKHAAVDEEIVISPPGYTLPSTISLPASEGAAPCVVFFAGSGPTDRDWTSPLLPGKNGSGAQLALGLQARGVGSIRFDKVGSGVNMPKSNAPADLKMLEVLSLAHYVDEAFAAFEELATRDRCGKTFFSATVKDRSTPHRRPSRSRPTRASVASSACPGPRARSSTPRSSRSGRSAPRPGPTRPSSTIRSRTFAQRC